MKKMHPHLKKMTLVALLSSSIHTGSQAQDFRTQEYPMLKSVSKNIKSGWSVTPLLTIGEVDAQGNDANLEAFGYRPVGILDGIGAYASGSSVVLFVNHEVSENSGHIYTLENGTPMIGSRISKIKVNKKTRKVVSAELAYNEVFDRYGNVVTAASQISEGGSGNNGFNRFCSGYLAEKYYNGFETNIYFAGEEVSDGQLAALDVAKKQVHVVPMAGRAGWENVTSLENYNSNKVVMLFGDDRSNAPMILYIGEKGTTAEGYNPSKPFLKNNGLANGHLYVWVSDSIGENTPVSFYGTGSSRTGKFIRVNHFDPSMAGATGYDALGFVNQAMQDSAYDQVSHFEFSRPEDIATNPDDKTQVVLASTGNSDLFGGNVENWGVIYVFDVDDASLMQQLSLPLDEINNIAATVTIVYDGNDAGAGQFASPDFGIRSPDNLDWAENGYLYINEDRSFDDFALISGIEASVWQLDPTNGMAERILEMDRNAVPYKQLDNSPADTGNWESSGVLDVTSLFNAAEGETILVMDVQAHSVTTGPIGGSADLVQGGQLLLVSKVMSANSEKLDLELRTQDRENISASPVVTITPNPANSFIQIDRVADIKVLDLNGKLLLQESEVNYLDVSGLKAGVYMIEIDHQTLKLVIQ